MSEITKTINHYEDFTVEITADVFDHEGNHELKEIAITAKGDSSKALFITEMFDGMTDQQIETFFNIDWGTAYTEYQMDAKEFKTHFSNY